MPFFWTNTYYCEDCKTTRLFIKPGFDKRWYCTVCWRELHNPTRATPKEQAKMRKLIERRP